MAQKKIFHKEFLEVVAELRKGNELTSGQLAILKGQAAWTRRYLENKRTAATAPRTSYGRPKKPDDQVSAASLKKREYRASKV